MSASTTSVPAPAPPPMPRLSYRKSEFCEATGLKITVLEKLISTGVIPTRKVFDVTLILHSDALAALEKLPYGRYQGMRRQNETD